MTRSKMPSQISSRIIHFGFSNELVIFLKVEHHLRKAAYKTFEANCSQVLHLLPPEIGYFLLLHVQNFDQSVINSISPSPQVTLRCGVLDSLHFLTFILNTVSLFPYQHLLSKRSYQCCTVRATVVLRDSHCGEDMHLSTALQYITVRNSVGLIR